MTITRTFGTKFAPSYVAGTIIEVVHFRDMVFDADEMVAIYLDTCAASMDLGSLNIAKFPEYEGDESDTEKVLILNKSEGESNKLGLKILTRKNNTGNWEEDAEIILVNRGRKDYLDWRSYTGLPTRIMEKNDAIAVQLVDYGDGLLWDTDFIKVRFGCTIEVSKKNDLTELTNRLAALENLLGLFGAATPTASGTNGLVKGAEAGKEKFLLRGDRTWQKPNFIFTDTEEEIKTKYLIGTTAANEGGIAEIAHGLIGNKIIGIQVFVRDSINTAVSGKAVSYTGYDFDWFYGSDKVYIINVAANSINILNKPVSVFVTYLNPVVPAG
jgi:hypothetical protein